MAEKNKFTVHVWICVCMCVYSCVSICLCRRPMHMYNWLQKPWLSLILKNVLNNLSCQANKLSTTDKSLRLFAVSSSTFKILPIVCGSPGTGAGCPLLGLFGGQVRRRFLGPEVELWDLMPGSGSVGSRTFLHQPQRRAEARHPMWVSVPFSHGVVND